MALDRKDENAWEAHYNMTALGGFIEGQTALLLSPTDQVIARNQMHAATLNWSYFYLYSFHEDKMLQTGASRRLGLTDDMLNRLLSLAVHATKLQARLIKEDDSSEVFHSQNHSQIAPATTYSAEAVQKRLEEEYEIKRKFDYEKQCQATNRDAVPVFDRSRDPPVLADFLSKLALALKGWYKFGSEPEKVAFIRSKCSPETTIWLDSLAPIPDSAALVIAAIQSEHEVQDDEMSARSRLFALKLRPPYTPNSFDVHAAAFDKLLPLVPTIDRVSLRSSFLFTLPPAMKAKLEDMAISKSMTSSTYVQMKALGRELWTNNYRPELPTPVVHVHQLCVQSKTPSRQLSNAESLALLAFNCYYCDKPGHYSRDCLQKQQDAKRDKPLQSNQQQHQRLKDLQVEVKALALKLERSAAPTTKTKKARAQAKAAQVKAPPAELDSRFDSCSNISVPASSDLDDIVSNLNKSLPPLHSLRLLPNQFRMDLLAEEDQQPSTQADQSIASIAKMERELQKGDPRGFDDRRLEYLEAASNTTAPTVSPTSASEVSRLRLNSMHLEPGSTVPLAASSARRLEMNALVEGTPITVLLDTGAQAMFMGVKMAARLGLQGKPVSKVLQVAYAKEDSGDTLSKYVTARVQMGSYWKDLNFYLADIGDLAIFGVPWFLTLCFALDWSQGSIRFTDRLTGRFHNISDSHQGIERNTTNPAKTSRAIIGKISLQELTNVKRSCRWVHVVQLKALGIGSAPLASRPVPAPNIPSPPDPDRWIQSFPSLFGKMSGLPIDRPETMVIETDPLAPVPRSRPLAHLAEAELKSLKATLTDLLDRGFIRPSTSAYGAAILFAKKADGSLRLCVDYRGLNQITTKTQGPLPMISEMRNRLAGAKFFTKLDLKDGYHNIRISKEDIHKTAFKCRYGHFEYTVVPFGLANAPAVFSNLMNRVLQLVLDVCCISYMDDILIYSETKEQHERDVTQVLSLLEKEKLYLKASKCEFFRTEVEFCGNVITSEGIKLTASKVLAMQSRPTIRRPHDIQVYLGTMVWFKDFIPDFSSITEPLTRLLVKDSRWYWGQEQEEAISILIHLVTTAPILKFFDSKLETFVYSDASDFAVGGWIGQKHGDRVHPVCYWSRKMTPAERGYAIYDKELLALITMVEKHSHLLRGVPFTCNTDHRALENLQTQVKLKGRQIRWILTLQEYDFKILYQPASKMRVADWLTRNPTMHTLCTKCSGQVELKALTSSDATSFIDQVKEAYKTDVYIQQLMAWKKNPKVLDSNSFSLLQRFSQAQDLWYYNDSKVVKDAPVFRVRLYIPDNRVLRTALLQRYHESLVSGHQAAERTTRQMEKLYYWPGMRTEIKSYTSSCESCQRQQESNHSKYGLLHPLPIPDDRGVDLSIDWFFPGTSVDGFDAVMVVICRLTKLLVLIPCHKTDTAEKAAGHFIKHWFSRGYGLPQTITTDRDSKFTSDFWGAFSKQLDVQTNFATPRHQQTNGQAEIQVRIVKKVLRKYADYDATNWSRLIHLVEFSLNNAINTSTGYSPFYLFFGFEPRVFPEEYVARHSKATANLAETIGSVLLSAQSHIAASQAEMAVRYNRNRKEAPRFATGSSVWVKAEGIAWPAGVQRPKPLSDSMLGPFLVTKGNEAEWPQVGLNVELELPPSLGKVHPIFHVEKLEPFIGSSKTQFPDRAQYAPAPVVREGILVAEVEHILDHRYHSNRLQYLLKFVGYPISEAEWHSYSADDPSWEDDVALVVAFQAKHGLPSRPSSRRNRIARTNPTVAPTHVSSSPSVPAHIDAPVPAPAQSSVIDLPPLPQGRTTRQTRNPVLTPGLCY